MKRNFRFPFPLSAHTRFRPSSPKFALAPSSLSLGATQPHSAAHLPKSVNAPLSPFPVCSTTHSALQQPVSTRPGLGPPAKPLWA
jgi:hypothetical protein